MTDDRLGTATERALAGNLERYGEKLASEGKLFVRERLRLLLDDDLVEDALLANALAGDLPADGVVTGIGKIDG
ncbi:MAG TPA: acyl-CoA carboxylase subunit beta, partial [Acidimicrobiia bacterium]|nr:acyl-CoA carboxylase subunit beta [Acidimicrobiia bacterium]